MRSLAVWLLHQTQAVNLMMLVELEINGCNAFAAARIPDRMAIQYFHVISLRRTTARPPCELAGGWVISDLSVRCKCRYQARAAIRPSIRSRLRRGRGDSAFPSGTGRGAPSFGRHIDSMAREKVVAIAASAGVMRRGRLSLSASGKSLLSTLTGLFTKMFRTLYQNADVNLQIMQTAIVALFSLLR